MNRHQYARSCRTDIPTYREVEEYPEKILAYLLGLIASDGNLINGSIRIELVEEDRETIEFFARSTIANSNDVDLKVKQRTGRKSKPTIAVCARLPKLWKHCIELGITPKKSLTLDINLEGKSDEFKWYFLRGMLDGDGCIQVNNLLSKCSIRLACSSLNTVVSIQKIFGGTYCKQRGCYSLQFKGKMSKQLALHLPSDDFCMKRKTKPILEIAARECQVHRRSSILIGEIWGVYEKPLNVIEVWRQSEKSVTYETVKWRMKQGQTLEEALR